MSRSVRWTLAVAAAVVLAAALSSSASANNLSLGRTSWRIHWSALTFTKAGNNIACPVLLAGTFHSSTLGKTEGGLIGSVTEAALTGACTGGLATVLTETLPWHLRYGAFIAEEGLPFIEGVQLKLVGAAFRVADDVSCLIGTTAEHPAVLIADRDVETARLTSVTADPNAGIPSSGLFICMLEGEARLSGTASIEDGLSELIPVFLM
jgi:hypothetical protein